MSSSNVLTHLPRGSSIVFRLANSGWLEGLVLLGIPGHSLWHVIFTVELDLRCMLLTVPPLIDLVYSFDLDRPIVALFEDGQPCDRYFEVGPLGRVPTASEIDSYLEEAESVVDEFDDEYYVESSEIGEGFLRGGGLAPPRVRHRVKKTP